MHFINLTVKSCQNWWAAQNIWSLDFSQSQLALNEPFINGDEWWPTFMYVTPSSLTYRATGIYIILNWAVFLVLTRLMRVTNAAASMPQTWPAGHAQLQFVEHVMMYVTMYICNDVCVHIVMKCGTLTHSPVDWYGHQSEHRCTDTQHGNKLGYLAVELAKYPVAVQHIVIVEGHVQTGDHRIGYGQVHCEEYTKVRLSVKAHQKWSKQNTRQS